MCAAAHNTYKKTLLFILELKKKGRTKKKKLEGVEFTVTVLIRTFLTHNIYIYLASLPFAINVFFNLI